MKKVIDFSIVTNPQDIPIYYDNNIYFEKIYKDNNEVIDGAFRCIRIETEDDFKKLLEDVFSDKEKRIFRGQRCYDWYLTSTLEREFIKSNLEIDYKNFVKSHFDNFLHLSRGKIKEELLLLHSDNYLSQYELWAIGQHLGLKSVLLDWTFSFFHSLYFAFEEIRDEKSNAKDEYRVIFSLPYDFIKNPLLTRNPHFLFEPRIDPYKRLTAQNGLFTTIPFIDNTFIHWKKSFQSIKNGEFLKIYISNKIRDYIINYLNRINVNYLTVYPDLQGVVNYCNNQITLK